MERALQNRRMNTTQRVIIGGKNVYVTVGFFDEARKDPGEIFLSLDRTGDESRWAFDEIARLASKLLQYGCPVEDVAHSWIGTKGQVCGIVQDHERIKYASSVLDFCGKVLLIEFCGRSDMGHVAAETTST